MKQLVVALDLDDTLIPNRDRFLVESNRGKWYIRPFTPEPFRRGTLELLKFCKEKNFKLWVYTASLRPVWYIRLLFLRYGYHLDGVVNVQKHFLKVKVSSHKYPPQFGIDVLVDNSKGVVLEGQQLGYDVIYVNEQDTRWVEKVKKELEERM